MYSSKRHGAAALHDLAEEVACNWSRQRRGVRQPYAAFSQKRFHGLNAFAHPNETLQKRKFALWPHAEIAMFVFTVLC
jgi:hypothetical protein